MTYPGMDRSPSSPQRLIAIIGIDGAGKSTQIAAVRGELARCGHQVSMLPNESLAPLWERLDEVLPVRTSRTSSAWTPSSSSPPR
jgi:thymidylate kinase